MTARNSSILLSLAGVLMLGIGGCTGDEGDIAERRDAARQVARKNRDVGDAGPVVRDTALPARYRSLDMASVEEVAEAIDAIPVEARRIRAAKAIGALTVKLVPEPIVIGPRARGDLQLDNTAPLETIRNAVEGSALAYTRVHASGVVIADVVAARLDGDALTVYVAAPD